MECKEGYYLESKECKQWYLNYINWMKCTECLEWYVKDVDLETFNCRNVTKVEFCFSVQNGECIQCLDEFIVTTNKIQYKKSSKYIIRCRIN